MKKCQIKGRLLAELNLDFSKTLSCGLFFFLSCVLLEKRTYRGQLGVSFEQMIQLLFQSMFKYSLIQSILQSMNLISDPRDTDLGVDK